ncbi:LysR family transcriptional regulator [Eoetvoesiella caeni]|nr:LysR family transcriptional regulator [Eoetvoesiella caeni]MCI2811249.1 LysR family transcriptional regulator [Eoetvoesiella caeni]NYT57142.1 LysR family transcriptional regulator [Eoetvoesiella caeni]
MNITHFDLVTLRVFIAIARSGSVTRGARAVNMAVAAASKRVSNLEDHLGTRLLFRYSRGVKLTEAGNTLFQHALELLQSVERMSGVMSEFRAGTSGRVRIWANTSSITQFLPGDLSVFMRSLPGIAIDLEERNSDEVVAALRENRADIGIFEEHTPAEDISSFGYQKDELVLIVPKNHQLTKRRKISLADAIEYDFVSLPPSTSIAKRLLTESTKLNKPLKLQIQVRSFDAICRMVQAGLGIGILPRIAAQPYMRSLGLKGIPLNETWAQRHLLLGLRDTAGLAVPVRLLATSLCPQITLAPEDAS